MLNKNPTIIINGLNGLAQQILPLLIIVGVVDISPEKLAAAISIIGLILTFISTTILRSQVTPNETSDQLVREGVRSPKGTSLAEVKERVEEING